LALKVLFVYKLVAAVPLDHELAVHDLLTRVGVLGADVGALPSEESGHPVVTISHREQHHKRQAAGEHPLVQASAHEGYLLHRPHDLEEGALLYGEDLKEVVDGWHGKPPGVHTALHQAERVGALVPVESEHFEDVKVEEAVEGAPKHIAQRNQIDDL